MARKVKCVDTGEYSTSDVAFQAPNKKYFSNKRAYEMWENNKTYREKCINAMYDIMGYSTKMIIPTIFYKKLKNFDGVGYEALYNTMVSQRDSVNWAMINKVFTSEAAKVMYIMTIFENHVMDEYKKIIKENEERERLDGKNAIIEVDDLAINSRKKKGTDVSSLLGNDDWI